MGCSALCCPCLPDGLYGRPKRFCKVFKRHSLKQFVCSFSEIHRVPR